MLNVAIVAGGDSGESGISLKSGRQVELHIDRSRYNPFLIVIRGSDWFYAIEKKKFRIDKNDFSLTIGRKKIRFSLVFNAIHGTPGENGKLLGYFDMLKIPYTSSDVTTSALAFNKSFCKQVVRSQQVNVAGSVHLTRQTLYTVAAILEKVKLPVFVKPNNGGSSVGMSKVNLKKDLKPALELAFREDDEVLVEEYIAGRELTCGVLRSNGKIEALPVTEIIPKKEYFDFEAKYKKGMSDEVVPARIPVGVASACSDISKLLYEVLLCKGIVRFDFIYTGSEFYFLEVNTVPGMTAASIVPKMAAARGWTFTELITRIIEETLNGRKS
jgi:D-alanine-D-alanine ligase